MQCHLHPQKSAIALCLGCHNGLCEECRIIYDGKSVCADCYKKICDIEKEASSDLEFDLDKEAAKLKNEFDKFLKDQKIDMEIYKIKEETNEKIDKVFSKFQDFIITKKSSGYLICESCAGYYKLQSDESPDEFVECECGGILFFSKTLKN